MICLIGSGVYHWAINIKKDTIVESMNNISGGLPEERHHYEEFYESHPEKDYFTLTRASRHNPRHPRVIEAAKKRKRAEKCLLDLESEPKYTCPDKDCVKEFETRGQVLNHIDKNHEKEKKKLRKMTHCSLCKKYLKGSLKRHENDVHLMQFENIIEHTSRRSKVCKTCTKFSKKETKKISPWEPSINPTNQHLVFCIKEYQAQITCPLCLHCPIKW